MTSGRGQWRIWFEYDGEPFSSDELMTEERADELADVIRTRLSVEPIVKDEG